MKEAKRRSKQTVKDEAVGRELDRGARAIEKLKDAVRGDTGFETTQQSDFQAELVDRVQGLQSASSYRDIRTGLEREAEEQAAAEVAENHLHQAGIQKLLERYWRVTANNNYC